MSTAKWIDEIVAESDDIVTVEGNKYFPFSAVKQQFLIESNHTTYCSWKGVASYFHLKVNDHLNENAAWYYEMPKEAATCVKNRIAFWKGVQVE